MIILYHLPEAWCRLVEETNQQLNQHIVTRKRISKDINNSDIIIVHVNFHHA